MKKKTSASMHPVLRAQVRAKWASTSVNAQIHALFGDNKDKLLAYSSILMFVASACATQLDMAQDNIKFRVIRGAINALDDLKDKQTITQVDRGSIYAGLLASQELIEDTAIEIVDDAAQMYYRMEQQMGMA
jgi:response regulator RpfG family c-di-GMP phosphodiesterase